MKALGSFSQAPCAVTHPRISPASTSGTTLPHVLSHRCKFSGYQAPRRRNLSVVRAQQNPDNEHKTPQPEMKPDPSQKPKEQEPEVDVYLSKVWDDLKKDLRNDLDPEAAKALDSLSYEDLLNQDSQVMRKLAEEQLAPILQSMGIEDDPLVFFMELLQLATFIQFVTCGVLFYSAELWGHYDTGEAFRAVCGLGIGYLSRPFFKVEQLLWPVYNAALQALVPNATYEVSPSSRADTQTTLNQLGIAIAASFFIPQYVLHWDYAQSTQFSVPLAMGWFMFDVCYMFALLFKLRMI